MGALVTFTLCVETSEITETVDAATKFRLLIFGEIKRRELATQTAVTRTDTETSRTCKQCTTYVTENGRSSSLLKYRCWFLTMEEVISAFPKIK